MTEDTYKTLKKPSQGLYKDKGSKFIALAYPVKDEEHIGELLIEAKNSYHDARHHCYAWGLGQTRDHFRMNDDGEPSGTAGKPIYGQILSHNLTMVLIVVVRYFGGTKLGVRGLINAYKGAAHDAISNGEVITKVIHDRYRVKFDYLAMNDVMRILKDHDLTQSNHNFDLTCSLDFSVRKSISDEVAAQFEAIPNTELVHLCRE